MTTAPARSLDDRAVATLKGLVIDAIQAANSGHPGMPLGCAEIAIELWRNHLRFDPSDPAWPDRDRFVLSAGHGSMLQYALLHLFGFDLPLDEIKQFRQLHSKTPGHPERGHTVGIETTTGPLGQGLANGVGMALSAERLRALYGTDLIDHRIYVIAGDGCMQEGVASEAASLAGHLGLGRLVVFYDSNHISIDGRTELTFTEDVAKRFEAYGWHVQSVDGHDRVQVAAAITAAKACLDRPNLLVCDTIIGRGSPKLAGSHKVHGAPLGPDEVKATKLQVGLDPDQSFAIDADVLALLRSGNADRRARRTAWYDKATAGEAGRSLLAFLRPDRAAQLAAVQWPIQAVGTQLSTRKAGEKVLAAVGAAVPQLVCGSADLGHSTFTILANEPYIQRGSFAGRNVYWGVREHGMGSVANGLACDGAHVPVVSTFLVFHDYMRPSVRLAALMGLQVLFVYTHDSIFVGEDGPTHQPVETLGAMRLIPGLVTLRPADLAETCAAYQIALQRTAAPTAMALTRQNLPELAQPAGQDVFAAVGRGGYVLQDALGAQVTLAASGSEVHVAVAAAALLGQQGIAARVVSMPSHELFDAQDAGYRAEVLPANLPVVTVEAGSTLPWRRFVGPRGACVGIDTFGASAPDKVLAKHFGLTAENVAAVARTVLG
ncbi:MAG: transketolase [Deltaproteobacteria bacterium]|nr:transketolase [Deltaproteobacteria bacterium]